MYGYLLVSIIPIAKRQGSNYTLSDDISRSNLTYKRYTHRGFNRGCTAAFFSVSQPGGCCNSNCPVEDLKLIGVGWNEENGFYTAEATGNVGTTWGLVKMDPFFGSMDIYGSPPEAQLPKMPGRSAGAVPLRWGMKLVLHVEWFSKNCISD